MVIEVTVGVNGIRVVGATTVDEALMRSSARSRDLATYLRWLKARLADGAVRPYMRDRGFDFQRIRQRVRVSSEPLRFDEFEAREREAATTVRHPAIWVGDS